MVAWKACAFSIQRWELGPGYYCPTCDYNPDNDRYRDKARGCPTCPLTESFTQIRVINAEKLIKKFPPGWTIDRLIEAHGIVSGILHENKDRIDPRWSITFAELCRIIQQEQAQAKFEQDWISWKKIKSAK